MVGVLPQASLREDQPEIGKMDVHRIIGGESHLFIE